MDVFQIRAIAGGANAAIVVPVVMGLLAKAYASIDPKILSLTQKRALSQ